MKHFRTKTGTALATMALAAATLSPVAAHAAPETNTAKTAVATSSAAQYFKMPYNGDIWLLDKGSAYKMTFELYARYGMPRFTVAAADYVKYPWSDAVYAVSFLGGANPNSWAWKRLTFSEWVSVGAPQPRNAGWVAGTEYWKWATDDAIYALAPDGKPAHHLSFTEWRDSGFQPFINRTNLGFMKLPFKDTVIYYTDISHGVGTHLTGAQWAAFSYPGFHTRNRLPGDRVWKNWNSDTVYYTYPGNGGTFALTYTQWRSIGSPAPQVVGPAPKPVVTATPVPTTTAPKPVVTATPVPTTTAPKPVVTATPVPTTTAPKPVVTPTPTPTVTTPTPTPTQTPIVPGMVNHVDMYESKFPQADYPRYIDEKGFYAIGSRPGISFRDLNAIRASLGMKPFLDIASNPGCTQFATSGDISSSRRSPVDKLEVSHPEVIRYNPGTGEAAMKYEWRYLPAPYYSWSALISVYYCPGTEK